MFINIIFSGNCENDRNQFENLVRPVAREINQNEYDFNFETKLPPFSGAGKPAFILNPLRHEGRVSEESQNLKGLIAKCSGVAIVHIIKDYTKTVSEARAEMDERYKSLRAANGKPFGVIYLRRTDTQLNAKQVEFLQSVINSGEVAQIEPEKTQKSFLRRFSWIAIPLIAVAVTAVWLGVKFLASKQVS